MKTGDQKVERTLKKQTVRGLPQDKKVPGTSTGTRMAAGPGPHSLGLLQDSWERAGLTAPYPAKQGPSNTVRDLVAWSCREGNKDEVVNQRKPWVLAAGSWKLGRERTWPGQSPDGWVVGQRGYWSYCCRGIPQSAPEGLFPFVKILLLNPGTPYKERPVLSHSPHLQLNWGVSGPGVHLTQL